MPLMDAKEVRSSLRWPFGENIIVDTWRHAKEILKGLLEQILTNVQLLISEYILLMLSTAAEHLLDICATSGARSYL